MENGKVSPVQKPPAFSSVIGSPRAVFAAAVALRIVLLVYGSFQDAHSALKYTDIDYYVFTDAARFVSRGRSPYERATYRYTPLLAWMLLPTTWPGGYWFSFGKILFAASDVVAGWMILAVLRRRRLSEDSAVKYACAWLLNPMVATISTRGSSEGLLCVMVMAVLWAVEMRYVSLAGVLLGLSVHFKIYPFIYGVSILWALEAPPLPPPPPTVPTKGGSRSHHCLSSFLTKSRMTFLLTSLTTFLALNTLMYTIYGQPFLHHTFLHHVTRLDHRHNFSPYNTLLYLSSAAATPRPTTVDFSRLAFLPQLLLSTVLIPLALAKLDLPTTLLAQTFAFVTFNKVCTSQYFLWYLIFLPVYLPSSSFIHDPRLGIAALGAWVAAQALWLQQGYELEFLGRSTFVPGLWMSGLLFFGVNVWILGIIIGDVRRGRRDPAPVIGQGE
jgi:phosphatidylinositol glycan class M